EPRFYDKDSSGHQVFAHGTDRLPEPVELSNVAYGAKEANHDIKSVIEGEIGHICLIKADSWESLSSDGQHFLVLVETDDIKVIDQVLRMSTSAASSLQQPISRWIINIFNLTVDILMY